MYLNASLPVCKLEIRFSSLQELRNFFHVMNTVNSISKEDYSYLVNNLHYLIHNFEQIVGLESDNPDFLPFCDDDEEV